MQNPIQKFRQKSIVFEKPGILSEKLKTFTSSNYNKLWQFLLKFCTRSLLTNVYKIIVWDFLILFRTWVICSNKKRSVFCTLTKTKFINNSRSKQNKKKNSEHTFVDIGKMETRAKIQQKIFGNMEVGTRQGFQFFWQITWFLGHKRASFLYI